MGIKDQRPPGGSKLCIIVPVPAFNRPRSFCMRCGIPLCTHNALTWAWTPVGKAQQVMCHQAAVQGLHFGYVGAKGAKKANDSPEGRNCASWFSENLFPIDSISFACDLEFLVGAQWPYLCVAFPLARHNM